MSSEFHNYIFDFENKSIKGDFEGAYRNCQLVWPEQRETNLAMFRYPYGMLADKDKPVKTLDIGCGYGYFVKFLHEQGFDSHGIDISESAVQKGKQIHGADLNIKKGNLLDGLSFDNDEFDAVFLLGVFWFLLDNVDYCLDEISRVLKNDSLLFASVFIPRDPINKNMMKDYSDFVSYFTSKFNIVNSVSMHNPDTLLQRVALEDSQTSMLLTCKKL